MIKTIPEEWTQESADEMMVRNAAEAMRAKLQVKRLEGRYGWHRPDMCAEGDLMKLLVDEMVKEQPDMVDVMNYAGFIFNRQQRRKELDEMRAGYTKWTPND